MYTYYYGCTTRGTTLLKTRMVKIKNSKMRAVIACYNYTVQRFSSSVRVHRINE